MGYRVTFLLRLFRIFFIPTTVIWLAFRVFPGAAIVPAPLRLLSIPISSPIFFTVQTICISFRHARAASRLGALPIPVVRGRWPGNLDILRSLLRGWRHGYINDTLRDYCVQYQSPTINIRVLWIDQIWTMDPNHMKHILVTGFSHFDKGAPQRERMKGFLGTGIFAADGEIWKMHRTMARPFLAKSTTSDADLFTRHVNDALARLEELANSAWAFDLQELSQRYASDVALDAFFGIRDDEGAATLRDPGCEAKTTTRLTRKRAALLAATHAMDVAADVTILRARRGTFESHPDISVIEDARDRKEGKEGGDDGFETFLDHLVHSTEDESIIRDQLINMVLGSRDTTVAFLTFTMYLLALHPDIHAKLRTEVITHCPPNVDDVPTSEKLRDFVYLRAILDETLRLFPSVPINTRYSTHESVLPPAVWLCDDADAAAPRPQNYTRPLYMPPRTSVSLLKLLMQRRADLWGPHAEECRPERWLAAPNSGGGDGGVDRARQPARAEWFIPFSAGPRLCPGKNFAYAEVTYFLIAVVRRGYVFSLSPEHQPRGTLPPEEWKTDEERPLPLYATDDAVGGAKVSVRNGRRGEERCWPAAAFTLYSKGGLWMKVSKLEDRS